MAGPTFREAELAGWDRKAASYDGTLGTITPQAVGPLLDAAGAAPGRRLLDLACGTGAVAAEAARRGAEVLGLDFAPAMTAEARRRHPGIDFRVGDAEAIPLPDAAMDTVICAFGMLHMDRPERVLAEIARVLRPGGRFAMTAWTPAGDFFALVGAAVNAHADTTVPLPPAPPIFRFADPAECRSALLGAGFGEPSFRQLDLLWTGDGPEAVLALLHGGTVRTPMIIEAQAPEARAQVEQAVLRGAERYARDGRTVTLRWPALLTMAGRA
ncbi:class I SAM-dependent methyltransferase [Roseicella aerolata]|uniref:Methyltransferase domain-containing protein n=1 Tax=Roseicella aerolata TaxID=2883479 RepID=A0A9X1ICM1_9PROT|nr:methyltransferase domain-containing protein [Roseicella aerolata]MCB4821489.1 methyltransferase domain-containing protein [Roseicella aerolata]